MERRRVVPANQMDDIPIAIVGRLDLQEFVAGIWMSLPKDAVQLVATGSSSHNLIANPARKCRPICKRDVYARSGERPTPAKDVRWRPARCGLRSRFGLLPH